MIVGKAGTSPDTTSKRVTTRTRNQWVDGLHKALDVVRRLDSRV